MPTHTVGTSLPSIGAPLRGWDSRKVSQHKGENRQQRQAKLGLWTSVALQHHFSLQSRTVNSVEGLTRMVDALPPEQPRGRLTLAQKMGLVPLPPPPPTEDDWRCVQARAALRQELHPISTEKCSICHESFYATSEQGQIILSCSHVFHEQCFKQFERFMRAQHRLERNSSTVLSRLACPECRTTHYHKRTFFAGKALLQRVAIIRIQTAIRGYLARTLYARMRLQVNPEFRQLYIQQRLERLTRAWDEYMEREKRERECLLEVLDAHRQAAQAAFLTEGDWEQILERRPSNVIKQQSTSCDCLGNTRCDNDQRCSDDCPICLEGVWRQWNLARPGNTPTTAATGVCDGGDVNERHEEIIATFRQQFDEKQRQREAECARLGASAGKKPPPKPPGNSLSTKRTTREGGAKTQTSMTLRTNKRSPPQRVLLLESSTRPPSAEESQNMTPLDASNRQSLMSPEPPAPPLHCAVGYRKGVILSCGHVFHDVCLSTFEQYNRWRTLTYGHEASQRCPLCRAGYAKHAF